MTTRKNAGNTRGRPFAPGNPGKPRGARHKATLAVSELLEGEAEALTRKAIERALEGDSVALRLCLDRIAPPRRDAYVSFPLPAIETGSDIPAALASILHAVARGELTPSEGTAIVSMIGATRAAFETLEIEARLAALEGKTA
jgi:hypothetical protein